MLFALLFSSLHFITIGMYLRLVDPSLICFVCALEGEGGEGGAISLRSRSVKIAHSPRPWMSRPYLRGE